MLGISLLRLAGKHWYFAPGLWFNGPHQRELSVEQVVGHAVEAFIEKLA